MKYICPVCGKEFEYDCGEHLVSGAWVCDDCFEQGRENGDIVWLENDDEISFEWVER